MHPIDFAALVVAVHIEEERHIPAAAWEVVPASLAAAAAYPLVIVAAAALVVAAHTPFAAAAEGIPLTWNTAAAAAASSNLLRCQSDRHIHPNSHPGYPP